MKRSCLVVLALFFSGCVDEQLCREAVGKTREIDFHKVTDNKNNVVVVALDTEPTRGSRLFQATLDHFGYEYYLLGAASEHVRYPPKHGLFKQAVLSMKSIRFHEILDQIIKTHGEDTVVVFSDAGDVLVAGGPDELRRRFVQMGKSIVFSGEIGCCNINMVPYVLQMAKRAGIEDPFSTHPEVVAMVKSIAQLMPILGNEFGKEGPVYLWTQEAQHLVAEFKRIPQKPQGPATQYRFLNSGGFVGYAHAIKSAFVEIDPQLFEDDQEQWQLWFVEQGYSKGLALLDYEQSIFKVTNEITDHDGDVRILFDDVDMPTRVPFRYAPGPSAPLFLHCAGCSASSMTSFRRQIVAELLTSGLLLDDADVRYFESC